MLLPRPEAQSGGARLRFGLGSANICSSPGPSATFLCPSGAGGIIKLLLFTLHSIFVSGLCHWGLRSQCRTQGNLWIFIQARKRCERGCYFSRDVAFPNPFSFPSPFLCPFPMLSFHALYSNHWTLYLHPTFQLPPPPPPPSFSSHLYCHHSSQTSFPATGESIKSTSLMVECLHVCL